MTASKNCIDLIKEFEGLRLTSYLCPANVYTIGYGSTRWTDGTAIYPNQKITMDIAETLLMHEVKRIVAKLPEMQLNQNQFDAVVSFCFNCGTGAFLRSTLYKKIKANPNDLAISNEFMKWTKARVNNKLVELKGLVRRRKAEMQLYFKVVGK